MAGAPFSPPRTASSPLPRDRRAFLAAELEALSGSLEVTVWPELYEQTRELWMEGNILLVLVRVRERGERLQIGVQRVALYQEGGGTARVAGLRAFPGDAPGPLGVRQSDGQDVELALASARACPELVERLGEV